MLAPAYKKFAVLILMLLVTNQTLALGFSFCNCPQTATATNNKIDAGVAADKGGEHCHELQQQETSVPDTTSDCSSCMQCNTFSQIAVVIAIDTGKPALVTAVDQPAHFPVVASLLLRPPIAR